MDERMLISFLVWIEENSYHRYKDGTWFTSKGRTSIHNLTKFYKHEEFVNLFLSQYEEEEYHM